MTLEQVRQLDGMELETLVYEKLLGAHLVVKSKEVYWTYWQLPRGQTFLQNGDLDGHHWLVWDYVVPAMAKKNWKLSLAQSQPDDICSAAFFRQNNSPIGRISAMFPFAPNALSSSPAVAICRAALFAVHYGEGRQSELSVKMNFKEDDVLEQTKEETWRDRAPLL